MSTQNSRGKRFNEDALHDVASKLKEIGLKKTGPKELDHQDVVQAVEMAAHIATTISRVSSLLDTTTARGMAKFDHVSGLVEAASKKLAQARVSARKSRDPVGSTAAFKSLKADLDAINSELEVADWADDTTMTEVGELRAAVKRDMGNLRSQIQRWLRVMSSRGQSGSAS